MDKHEVYEAWAPPGNVWSPWVKPVLFAHLPRPLPAWTAPAPHSLDRVPPPQDRWAVVVELPGPAAVAVAIDLAMLGYRPVPLFNACPPPLAQPPDPTGVQTAAPAVVEVDAILAALVEVTPRLQSLALPADAPPAFLIDADRQPTLQAAQFRFFDNRSVVFPTDFPSAHFLATQGIGRVLLFRDRERPLAWDLNQALRAWQEGGTALCALTFGDAAVHPLTVRRHWRVYDWWQRLLVVLRLRPNPQGGFGAFPPEPSTG